MTEIVRLEREPQLLDQPFAEQFALWAMRCWVAGLREGAAKSFSLQRGFEVAGIPEGLQALDLLLGTVATGAARSIDIRCIRCRGISDDERAILAALAGCQIGATTAARQVFECFLVPAAARIAAEHATSLAIELAQAGLHLHQPASRAAVELRVVAAQPCNETVH